MPKCMKVDCPNPATKALKLTFRSRPDGPGILAFVALVVCDEIHMPEEEVVEFYTMNFETMCTCMEHVGKIDPKVELTRFEWVPIEEAESEWAKAIQEAKAKI